MDCQVANTSGDDGDLEDPTISVGADDLGEVDQGLYPEFLERRGLALIDDYRRARIGGPHESDEVADRPDRIAGGDPVVDDDDSIVGVEVEGTTLENLAVAGPVGVGFDRDVRAGMIPVGLSGQHQASAEFNRNERANDGPAGFGCHDRGDSLVAKRLGKRRAQVAKDCGITEQSGNVGVVVHQREVGGEASLQLVSASLCNTTKDTVGS